MRWTDQWLGSMVCDDIGWDGHGLAVDWARLTSWSGHVLG
jgi:hypothetical protein